MGGDEGRTWNEGNRADDATVVLRRGGGWKLRNAIEYLAGSGDDAEMFTIPAIIFCYILCLIIFHTVEKNYLLFIVEKFTKKTNN